MALRFRRNHGSGLNSLLGKDSDAGLQAIATARRLGAVVTAFDVRSAVREQVESLGARFLELDFETDAEAEGGYARELTEEEQQRQREALNEAIGRFDVVITTAQV